MSTLRLTTISNQGGTASVPSETVINGSAKAWVNFNGTGTVAIRASFNVSSITDNGTGDYTVNFTNALADGNYSAVSQVSPLFGVYAGLTNVFDSVSGEIAGTSTAFRFTTRRADTSALTDLKYVCVTIDR